MYIIGISQNVITLKINKWLNSKNKEVPDFSIPMTDHIFCFLFLYGWLFPNSIDFRQLPSKRLRISWEQNDGGQPKINLPKWKRSRNNKKNHFNDCKKGQMRHIERKLPLNLKNRVNPPTNEFHTTKPYKSKPGIQIKKNESNKNWIITVILNILTDALSIWKDKIPHPNL